MRTLGMAALAVMLAGTAAAQEVASGADARRQLFREGRTEMVILPGTFLSPQEAAALAAIPTVNFPFYGAVAAAPDDGLASETTVARGNYHRVEDARAVVLAECNAKRRGARPCEIVAETRPQGWQPRAVQLSAGATATFRRDYGRRGERAMAVSFSTGGFALERGAGAAAAAVAACARASGAADCRVVIAD